MTIAPPPSAITGAGGLDTGRTFSRVRSAPPILALRVPGSSPAVLPAAFAALHPTRQRYSM